MTVICKIKDCPYCSGSGFCNNALVSINKNAQCGWIFDDHGMIKEGWNKKPTYKEEKTTNVEEWMGYTE